MAVTLPGKLTLHGVTKDVEIAAQARLEADGTVVVAGSLPILFSDYGIEAPNVGRPHRRPGQRHMEFRVVLAQGLSQPPAELRPSGVPSQAHDRRLTSRRAASRDPRSAVAAPHAARAMPAAKIGHGKSVGTPPSSSSGAFQQKATTTITPAARVPRRAGRAPTRTGRPARRRAAAARPNPTSARLTATGAQTGPAHGTGMRKSRSHVASEGGQPTKTHSQA